MTGLNEYIPIHVYTQRGLVEISDIYPGDYVYEYGTSNMIEVLNIEYISDSHISEVKYNDGRSQIYQNTELFFTGKMITRLYNAFDKGKVAQIHMYPTKFNSRNITTKLFPDPYIAGALIIHGRYDTRYINLPLDRSAADQLFAHKYNLDFADLLEDNTTFYAWNGTDRSQAITWKEFFPNYDFFATSGKIYSPVIPNEYLFSSINDRWKFIRGVFDIGYSQDIFPDSVGIAHWSEDRLKAVQIMLWSLGIASRITYDPDMTLARGREYRLDVIGSYDGYPGFFYDVDAIRKNIRNDHELSRQIYPFQLEVKSIGPYISNGVTINTGSMRNLLLEKSYALYITDNFLPRPSL